MISSVAPHMAQSRPRTLHAKVVGGLLHFLHAETPRSTAQGNTRETQFVFGCDAHLRLIDRVSDCYGVLDNGM